MRFFGSLPGGQSLPLGLLLATALPTFADRSLASRFSGRFSELESEIQEIQAELALLPDIPKDDSGGWEAYARHLGHAAVGPDLAIDSSIRFIWDNPAPVELIALIPARKYTPHGLDPEYGFPDDYSLFLIDESGERIAQVADVRSTRTLPSAHGLPFVHHLDDSIEASGVELRVNRLRPVRADGPGFHFFALAEIFCFSGERNLTKGSRISFNYDENIHASPYWSPAFMTDEITPLGLPEEPLPNRETWKQIGWVSGGKPDENAFIRITIDLGSSNPINGVRLFPAIRPSLVTFPGFAMPVRYRIEASPTGLPLSFKTILPPGDTDLPNPGNNPITVRFPETSARFIRIHPSKLWKPFQHYPAFLSFSEVQILNGETNLAIGAKVTTSENPNPIAAHGDQFWSADSLTDDYGPTGRLITRRNWLQLLGKRRTMEILEAGHLAEQLNIETRWQRVAATSLTIAGLTGLLAIIILPFRFRRRERRKIRLIRDRIAGDLHDDVGSNLGSIQLLAGSALSKPGNADELRLINQVAAETVTSVRDIVWLLRPRAEARVSTISHLRESASFLLEPLEWNLHTELEDFELNDTDGRNLVLFFREALHNVVRHANASQVEIRIDRKGPNLLLEIKDNGCGIPPEKLSKQNTLRALKQRSMNMKADLTIESDADKGTYLRLLFTPQPIGAKRSLRYPFTDPSE